MKAVVISIPYTGTRETLKILGDWGLGLGIEQQGAHITKPGWEELMASADNVVVPLRNRDDVALSAEARGQDPGS